jgi:hypothetical protein
MSYTISLKEYNGTDLVKGFAQNPEEALETIEQNFQKGLIDEVTFCNAYGIANELVKASGDPTNGGKLVPTIITNKKGVKTKVYKARDEIKHDEGEKHLDEGHVVTYGKGKKGTIRKNRGWTSRKEGAGHRYTVEDHETGKTKGVFSHQMHDFHGHEDEYHGKGKTEEKPSTKKPAEKPVDKNEKEQTSSEEGAFDRGTMKKQLGSIQRLKSQMDRFKDIKERKGANSQSYSSRMEAKKADDNFQNAQKQLMSKIKEVNHPKLKQGLEKMKNPDYDTKRAKRLIDQLKGEVDEGHYDKKPSAKKTTAKKPAAKKPAEKKPATKKKEILSDQELDKIKDNVEYERNVGRHAFKGRMVEKINDDMLSVTNVYEGKRGSKADYIRTAAGMPVPTTLGGGKFHLVPDKVVLHGRKNEDGTPRLIDKEDYADQRVKDYEKYGEGYADSEHQEQFTYVYKRKK